MPLYCSILSANIPHILGHGKSFKFSHIEAASSCLLSLHHKSPNNLLSHISFVSKRNQIYSSSLMEEENQQMFGLVSQPQAEEYSKELDVAVRAVHMACFLCQKLQDNLISKSRNNNNLDSSKDFNLLATVAGWSVKAIVSWILSMCLEGENIVILSEEDIQNHTLSNTNVASEELLEVLAKTVNECLAEAPRFGVEAPKSALGTSEVLAIINSCNSVQGDPSERFWALSPLDGIFGFVHGDQYAVALSLIEDGKVVVGVLGCPNYPMRKDLLSYQHSYCRIISKLSPQTSEVWNEGCVIYAKRGSGKAWIQPLLHVNNKFVWPNHAKQVSVSSIDNLALATFCEPVEKANSSHSFTDGLAHCVGLISNKVLKVHGMVKYAAIACGDAEVFMKFARAGYKEKTWDHAAGVLIIEEAGGTVTDIRGCKLNFSKGSNLEGIDRGIVACAGGATLHEKIIDAVDASWTSSSL